MKPPERDPEVDNISKSPRQTLEQLKAQLSKAKPVVVDSTGQLHAIDQNLPTTINSGKSSNPSQFNPNNSNAADPNAIPNSNNINGVKVKPSRWF